MGMTISVDEFRVTLGVFGDGDREPTVFLGSCEGAAWVAPLIEEMVAVAEASTGRERRGDHFWSCTRVTAAETVG